MKERPILFSAPMVRAILDGRKTQTRRALKIQPTIIRDPFPTTDDVKHIFRFKQSTGIYQCLGMQNLIDTCKFGKVGDRFWVRETWQHSNHPFGHLDQDCSIFYRADYWDDPHGMDGEKSPEGKYRDWKPSIHMPRWASRIDLEITGVRVERLQDISEADAIAEGAKLFDNIPIGTPGPRPARWSMENPTNTDQCLSTAKWAFANFFQKINGGDAWNDNPWVWVIEFKRINP